MLRLNPAPPYASLKLAISYFKFKRRRLTMDQLDDLEEYVIRQIIAILRGGYLKDITRHSQSFIEHLVSLGKMKQAHAFAFGMPTKKLRRGMINEVLGTSKRIRQKKARYPQHVPYFTRVLQEILEFGTIEEAEFFLNCELGENNEDNILSLSYNFGTLTGKWQLFNKYRKMFSQSNHGSDCLFTIAELTKKKSDLELIRKRLRRERGDYWKRRNYLRLYLMSRDKADLERARAVRCDKETADEDAIVFYGFTRSKKDLAKATEVVRRSTKPKLVANFALATRDLDYLDTAVNLCGKIKDHYARVDAYLDVLGNIQRFKDKDFPTKNYLLYHLHF